MKPTIEIKLILNGKETWIPVGEAPELRIVLDGHVQPGELPLPILARGQRFELHRKSTPGDVADLLELVNTAYFNEEENRLEVNLHTLEELLQIASAADSFLSVMFSGSFEKEDLPLHMDDLPIIEIDDMREPDEV